MRITRPHDTLRFEAPATAGRCGRAGTAGLLLQGTERGNGALILLRSGDSLGSGAFPLLARADSVTGRGAIVVARFMDGDAAHGVTLDSGSVTVSRERDALSASAVGSGAEVAGAGRITLEASFDSLRLGRDTVPCAARP